MSAPWMKFYPRDWRGEQALRAVSMAARGLWMDCLCIMHEAKPYGHLVLNGTPLSDDTLARMTGISMDEATALMTELRQAGVLSVTGKGVVYSRRMTRDFSRAQKGKKAADKRWAQPPGNKQEKPRPNGLPNGNPITQKPEARSQNAAAQQSASEFFYDRLIKAASARGPCHPSLAMGIGPMTDLIARGYSEAEIIETITERAKPEIGSWKYFVPIIEQRARDRAAIVPKPEPATIDWRSRLDVFRSSQTWSAAWGPKPGESGCQVPVELIQGQAA